MPLEAVKNVPRDFFDTLWCPVCGHREFKHIPHARTFCGECYTHFTIEWNENIDHGYVTADVEEAWDIADSEDIGRIKQYTESVPSDKLKSGWSKSEECGYIMTSAWGYEHDGWTAHGPEQEEVRRVEPRGKPATEWAEIARN